MQERFCTGLALAAAYWAEPTTPPDPETHRALLTAAAVARNIRCGRPIHRSRPRRPLHRH